MEIMEMQIEHMPNVYIVSCRLAYQEEFYYEDGMILRWGNAIPSMHSKPIVVPGKGYTFKPNNDCAGTFYVTKVKRRFITMQPIEINEGVSLPYTSTMVHVWNNGCNINLRGMITIKESEGELT